MSRSGYDEDYCDDNWGLIRYRGAVASALRGDRGQGFLRAMLVALDALPNKRLIEHELEAHGEVCALGAVALQYQINIKGLDPEDFSRVAETFGIADAMSREIVWVNE